ncbi:MAG: gfo/Idh/MocA family oxidoreductase, partial [Cyclobacteriaceae bacterium]|nr:gfo/Idh/MocA family oxidoreductase [Cyclobacteriaceae bacterium]
GCYPVQISRYLFGEEPLKVAAFMEKDPDWGIDILGSAMMSFPSGQCNFSVGTQLARGQWVRVYGTKKSIEVEMPFNPAPDRHPTIRIFSEEDPLAGVEVIEVPSKDQFTYQGDNFSRAILDDTEVPVSLEDTLGNTRC